MRHPQATDPRLFVHLTWKTHDDCPLLGNDQLQQAAFFAIRAKTRFQLCQVLAIGGTSCQVHLIASFPASLSVHDLLRIARDAAQEAITRQQEAVNGNWQAPRAFWQRDFTAHTLSAGEAAQAQAYLSQQVAAL